MTDQKKIDDLVDASETSLEGVEELLNSINRMIRIDGKLAKMTDAELAVILEAYRAVLDTGGVAVFGLLCEVQNRLIRANGGAMDLDHPARSRDD